VLGVPWLGDDGVLSEVLASGVTRAFVAVGDNRRRAMLARDLTAAGFQLITVISARAVVSPRAVVGTGVAIMPGVVINVDSVLGNGAIVNTAAHLDHDCRIGDFAHVGPGCALAGNVVVEAGAFLGVGTRVIPGRTVGEWSTLGAGSVVVRDVPRGVVAMGVPARVTRRMDGPL
jgi:UDP-perosamine 4-acetyltransferase